MKVRLLPGLAPPCCCYSPFKPVGPGIWCATRCLAKARGFWRPAYKDASLFRGLKCEILSYDQYQGSVSTRTSSLWQDSGFRFSRRCLVPPQGCSIPLRCDQYCKEGAIEPWASTSPTSPTQYRGGATGTRIRLRRFQADISARGRRYSEPVPVICRGQLLSGGQPGTILVLYSGRGLG